MDAFKLRIGTPGDDRFVARCFYRMWRDIGLAPDELLAPDEAEARVLEFLARGRAELQLASVIALDAVSAGLDNPVGCAVCQRHSLYPDILRPSTRGYGYIWGVYVDAPRRGAGLGARLTSACMDHLRAIGCTHAVLNTAPRARGLYERLGFTDNNEMRVELLS